MNHTTFRLATVNISRCNQIFMLSSSFESFRLHCSINRLPPRFAPSGFPYNRASSLPPASRVAHLVNSLFPLLRIQFSIELLTRRIPIIRNEEERRFRAGCPISDAPRSSDSINWIRSWEQSYGILVLPVCQHILGRHFQEVRKRSVPESEVFGRKRSCDPTPCQCW